MLCHCLVIGSQALCHNNNYKSGLDTGFAQIRIFIILPHRQCLSVIRLYAALLCLYILLFSFFYDMMNYIKQ